MHAHANIHAVSTPTPWGGSVTAAMTTPSYQGIRHLMAGTDLEAKLANGGYLKPVEIETALRNHHNGTTARIALKSTLGRLGLLRDN
jgi:hypothetical protein